MPISMATTPLAGPWLPQKPTLPDHIIFWHDPLRDAYASIGRIAGIRTRTEVSGMIPDNSKRPDVVYTSGNFLIPLLIVRQSG